MPACAAVVIGSLIAKLSLNSAAFTSGTKAAGDSLGRFSGKVQAGIGVLKRYSVVLLAAGAAVGYFLKRQMSELDKIAKASDRLGMSAENLQALGYAASQTGTDMDRLLAGMGTLAKRLGEAARGSGAAVPALDELGLSARDLIAMDLGDAFVEIADKLERIEEPARRNAIAANLFSKANQGLLNMLAVGGQGLRDYEAKAKSFGNTMTDSQIAKVVEAADRWDDFSWRMKFASQAIATEVAPGITVLANALEGLVGVLEKLHDAARTFGEAVVDIGEWVGIFGPDYKLDPKVVQASRERRAKTQAKATAEAATSEGTANYLQSLQDQINTFGLSSRAAELYRQKMAGNVATTEDLATALEKIKFLHSLEEQAKAAEKAADAMEAMREKAAGIFQATRTPGELLQQQLTDLIKLSRIVPLGGDAYMRQALQYVQQFRQAMGQTTAQLPQLLRKGTQEEYQARARHRMGTQQETVPVKLQAMLKELQDQGTDTVEIKRALVKIEGHSRRTAEALDEDI